MRIAIHPAAAADVRSTDVVLERLPQRLVCGLPLIVNAGASGYFRVSYDDATWAALRKAAPALAETDRLTLLLDTWALVQAGRAPIDRWLDLAAALRDDPSPLIGAQIAGVLESLDTLARGTDGRAPLREWARSFLSAPWQRLGWEPRPAEDLPTADDRAALLRALGKFGDPAILAEARRRALRFLDEPTSLPADLRVAVLSLAGRDADPALWDRLHALALHTADTEQKYLLYGALVTTQDPALAARALDTALSGELPAKLATRMVGRVAAEGEQPELAWAFARAHRDALLALCSAGEAHEYFARLARNFSTAARAAEIEDLTRAALPPEAARPAALAADEIRFKDEFKTRVWKPLAAWMAAHPAGQGSGR